MINNRLKHTFILPLLLHRDNLLLESVLCFSSMAYRELVNTRSQFLHSEELHYFDTLAHSKRQYSYLLGRYCSKQALSIYNPTLDSTSVLIRKGIFEQPVVYYPNQSNIQISISHTNTLGAALVFPENHPMGIDVETICPEKIATLQLQCNPVEQALLSNHTVYTDQAVQLTLLWTVKEALSKVLKCGFTMSLDLLEISTLFSQQNFTICYYKHFSQYKAASFIMNDSVCSIVLPRNTRFDIELRIIKAMEEVLINGNHCYNPVIDEGE
jgi:4'-phosphopantetheinyl transferase